jgi:hypothetical protein
VNRKPSTVNRLISWLSIAAAIVGLFLIGQNAPKAWTDYRRHATFHPVQATIMADSIFTVRTRFGDEAYVPSAFFRYVVDGRAHYGSNMFAIPRPGSREWARSMVLRFPPDATLTAYVDPDDPDAAFLDPDPYRTAYALLALGVVLLLCPVAVGVANARRG